MLASSHDLLIFTCFSFILFPFFIFKAFIISSPYNCLVFQPNQSFFAFFCRKSRDRERERDRERDRDRGREKHEDRRDKRPDAHEKAPTSQDVQNDSKEKVEGGKKEPEKEAGEPLKNEKEANAPSIENAEQWVDPWMRRKPQQNRSPEIRSPERRATANDDLSSIGSSDSEAGIEFFHVI